MRSDAGISRFVLPALVTVSLAASAQTPTPGQNVNMVSGRQWPGGDPFLQRQNEPSIAVSSRNSLHVLAGANDYRTVDLPPRLAPDALPNGTLSGDAWLGLFKSFNGGQTWQSTLLPGYPQDLTPEGLAFKQQLAARGLTFTTASDPVVRPGTNGLFYYAGIGFDRATGKGAVFVARFIDLNNRENGNAAPSSSSAPNTDPVRYLGTTLAATATNPGEFIDKPWMAVDMPRPGAGTCTFVVPQPGGGVAQSFAAGNVYLVYTKFRSDASGTLTGSQLFFTRSTDCGQHFSAPIPLVAIDQLVIPSPSVHQGAVVQVDPQAGFVYVAWRRFRDPQKPDSLFIAASIDRGRFFTPGFPVVSYPAPADPLHPRVPSFFDQGTTAGSFRTNAFPTLAVDDSGVPGWPGRVYLAWSQRMGQYGDARIMLLDFPGSLALTSTGLSLIPSMADSGPLTAEDGLPMFDDLGNPFVSGSQFMPQLTLVGGKLLAVYYDQRLDQTVGNYAARSPFLPDYLGRFFIENRVYPKKADGSPAAELPLWPGLVFGPFVTDAGLPLRRHTIDVVAAEARAGLRPKFTIARVSRYKIGTRPGSKVLEQLQVNPPGLPLFRNGTAANIGDYIDVGGQTFVPKGSSWAFNTAPSPAPVRIAAWTSNQDVRPPRDGDWTNYTAVGTDKSRTSVIDGSTAAPDCAQGQEGMRNQNIYSSRITEGLAVFSPQNTKPLSPTFQRVFVVVVQNFTTLAKAFRLRISRQPAQGAASFLQTQPRTTLEVNVGGHAGIARPVFAVSSNPTDSITVNVDEITGTPNGSVVAGGLSASVVLNADPSSPTLINPEGAPPGTDIGSGEVYNPDLANPDLANPDLANPDLANPDLANPDLANPDLANPDLANPDLANPDLANVGVTNPDLANPDLANPDLANFSVSDATYTLTNEGNTTASYKIKLVGTVPGDVKLQLILSRRYLTPVAFQCKLAEEAQNTVDANVARPPVTDPSNPDLANPDLANPDLANATLSLAPGERARVTIRANVDLARMAQIIAGLTPVAVAHAANTGTTTPQVSLALTATLPDGVVGVPYRGALRAFGGTAPYTFSAEVLPPDLLINEATGAISGTPAVATVFPPDPPAAGTNGVLVLFRVTDAAGRTAARILNLRIASPLTINLQGIPTAIQGTELNAPLSATGGIGPYTWSATGLPGWLTLSPDGTLSGTPPAAGDFSFDLTVSDSASPPQTSTVPVTLTACGPQGCLQCSQGAPCDSSNACATRATIECSSGAPVCTDRGFFPPGTSCGTDLVCSANGACLSCTEGSSCTSQNVCHTAAISCGTGDPVCVDNGNQPDGTDCGAGMTCVSGSCTVTAIAVAVLDDFSPDSTDDRLTLLSIDPTGAFGEGAVRTGFNFSQTIGGSRQVAATPDGKRVATVENAQQRLSVFDRDLNPTIPAIPGVAFGAVYATNGLLYALEGTTVDGTSLHAYDLAQGAEVQGSPSTTLRGVDLVVDEKRNVVWTAGSELRRGDALTLDGARIDAYAWSAVSIDLAPDGSVWVAERDFSTDSGNIHHYDAAGNPLATFPWTSSPFCVRVNPVTGDVWVAHSTGLSRIDVQGRTLTVEDAGSFWSIAVDPFQGLVWASVFEDLSGVQLLGGVMAYRSDGAPVSFASGFSTSQKYIALVAPALPRGLIARLSFAGNANDSSGNGFHGEVSGAEAYAADRHGIEGQALQFAGSTSVALPASPAFTLDTFTLYAVFRAPGAAARYPLINKGTATGFGNYYLGLLSDSGRGEYVEDVAGGNYSATTTLSSLAIDSFVHHTVTLQKATLSAYADGAPLLSTGPVPAPLKNELPVIIGAHQGFDLFFNGVIDEVLIFDRALSPAEVKLLHDRL